MRDSLPGRHLEVFLSEDDRMLEVDAADCDDDAVAQTLVAALFADDTDEAESLLRAGIGSRGSVNRRSRSPFGE